MRRELTRPDPMHPGNHGGPTALTAAADSFIVGAMREGAPPLTRCGFDGKVLWECPDFEPARVPDDLATGDGKAFYQQDNGKVFALDLATGIPIGTGPMGTTSPALFPVKTFVFGKGNAEADEMAPPGNRAEKCRAFFARDWGAVRCTHPRDPCPLSQTPHSPYQAAWRS